MKWRDIFYWSHHISAFSAGNSAFSCLCWIAYFNSFFFLSFSAICKFQCHFYIKVYYGNILLHFGLEVFKIYKIFINFFFLTTSNKFAIQNNPFRQLCLIFHKTLSKLKVWKFRSHRLDICQYLKKNCNWSGRGEEVLFCFYHSSCLYTKFPI